MSRKDDKRPSDKDGGGELSKRAAANLGDSLQKDGSSTDIEVDMSQVVRIPLGNLSSLGVGFASLPEAARTVSTTTTSSAAGLFRAVSKGGEQLTASRLYAMRDGSGFSNAIRRKGGKGFDVARLVPVDSVSSTVTTTIPYDPTTLFMAAALTVMNQKLDTIAETQRQLLAMFELDKKAEQRASLDTLNDVLDNYRYNWNVEEYKREKLNLVQGIRKDSQQEIIRRRANIQERLQPFKPVHKSGEVRGRAGQLKNEFTEYQLAVYLYGFATFLEVLLLENFDAGYLASMRQRIEERYINFQDLYSTSYYFLRSAADSSVGGRALGGVGAVLDTMGKAVEHTPLGAHTQIDEGLRGAGYDVGHAIQKDATQHGKVDEEHDIWPFVKSINTMSRLYNDPILMSSDGDALYLLPVEGMEADFETNPETASEPDQGNPEESHHGMWQRLKARLRRPSRS